LADIKPSEIETSLHIDRNIGALRYDEFIALVDEGLKSWLIWDGVCDGKDAHIPAAPRHKDEAKGATLELERVTRFDNLSPAIEAT